jgi:hypothetical protein
MWNVRGVRNAALRTMFSDFDCRAAVSDRRLILTGKTPAVAAPL